VNEAVLFIALLFLAGCGRGRLAAWGAAIGDRKSGLRSPRIAQARG